MTHIVLLGGGYGGLKIATELLKKRTTEDVRLTLIDRTPYHTIKTEFHALAAGAVADRDLRIPFPEDDRLTFLCDAVVDICADERYVRLGRGEVIPYDLLVIGLGAEDRYHQIQGAREFAYSVQSIENARKTFEAVQNITPYGQVTIVGAGLTGVELAGELRETRPDLKVRLLDRGETILPALPKKLQAYVTDWLLAHDVEIIHHAQIDYVENGAVCNGGECLLTDVTIWAGGVKPSRVLDSLAVDKDNYGCLVVNDWYQLPAYPNIYAVGDCVSSKIPPSAQRAKQQGAQIVAILEDVLDGRQPRIPAPITIKGSLGSLGKREGFGTAYGVSLSGMLARMMKSGVLWMHRFNQ